MFTKRKITTIDKDIDRDVELCRSTKSRVIRQTMQALLEEQIPVTQNWERVPLRKREKYRGAREICVIRTHYHQYQRARHILDRLEVQCRRRLILHAV